MVCAAALFPGWRRVRDAAVNAVTDPTTWAPAAGALVLQVDDHLRALVAANLVVQERRGREVMNRADYASMNAALAFLTDECCKGVALVREDAA